MSEVQNKCSTMKQGSDEIIQAPSQSQRSQPVFSLYRAPVFPTAASEDVAKLEQGPNKGENLLVSPKSLVHPLHRALLSAQEQIKRLTAENVALKEENSRLRKLRSSESLEEMTSLHNQAQKEKEEMEAMTKKLEEDLQKVKNDYQVLSTQQHGEISSLRAELLIAQSQSNWMEEELKESKRELHQGRRQVEREITSLEQSLRIQQEETAARLSSEHHWKEVIRFKEENAATTLRETEEKWQQRVCQLEEEIRDRRSLLSSLTDQMMNAIAEHKSTITLFRQSQSEFSLREKTWENKCNALEESYRRELTEKEESWQKRLQDMERRNELEKMWLQKETEWRHKTSSLEEEVRHLTRENTQLQGLVSKNKKRKPWWSRRLKLRRRQRHEGEGLIETTSLLPQSTVEKDSLLTPHAAGENIMQ